MDCDGPSANSNSSEHATWAEQRRGGKKKRGRAGDGGEDVYMLMELVFQKEVRKKESTTAGQWLEGPTC